MSVIVTVGAVGSVLVNTGVLTGVASAVAAAMGLRTINEASRAQADEERRAEAQTRALSDADVVQITTSAEDALSQVVAERCALVFRDDKVEMTVERDIRGKLTVRAHGEGVTRAELSARAQALLGGIQQQLAYRAALKTLKERGFTVETEERLADGTARVKVVKQRG